MKTIKYYMSIIAILFAVASCNKHEIEFSQQKIVDMNKQAAFQFHYIVPIATIASNNITKVELDNEIIYRTNITPFNGAPGGSVGKFFITTKGEHNIKLYRGSNDNYNLIYDKTFKLDAGNYYNMFVHSFSKDPSVINNNFPYKLDPVHQDSCGYLRFYNFLYENDTLTPTTLRLQYKYQDQFSENWIDIGKPVGFGESTTWQSIIIKRDKENINSGYAIVKYKIHVIDPDGTDLGPLKITNSKGRLIDYSSSNTCYIGRRYMHIFSGFRQQKTTVASARVWISL